MVNVTW